MKVLILDDDPGRHEILFKIFKDHDVVHSFTAQGAIHALRSRPRFDLVCLDHDLGDFDNRLLIKDNDPGEGMEVAEFISLHMERDKQPDQVLIHSHNPPAAARMAQAMQEAMIPHVVRPFKATWQTIVDIGRP